MTKARTRNVTKIFRQASPEDIAAGRDWYARASRLARELADSLPADHVHHGDVSRAAAVIAVLSPITSWPQNVRNARRAYGVASFARPWSATSDVVEDIAAELPTLKRNARKAALLLATSEPTDEIVKGPKVRAFWHTIANPSDPRGVVIDRHAIDVALGVVTDDATRGRALGRRGAYDEVAQTYVRAARILSRDLGEVITPAEVQAVTWTTWRRTRALANHGDAV